MEDLLKLTPNPDRPEIEGFLSEQFHARKIFRVITGGLAGAALLDFLWSKAIDLADPESWMLLDFVEAEDATGLSFKEFGSARKKLLFRKLMTEELQGQPPRLYCCLHTKEIQSAVARALKAMFPPSDVLWPSNDVGND